MPRKAQFGFSERGVPLIGRRSEADLTFARGIVKQKVVSLFAMLCSERR